MQEWRAESKTNKNGHRWLGGTSGELLGGAENSLTVILAAFVPDSVIILIPFLVVALPIEILPFLFPRHALGVPEHWFYHPVPRNTGPRGIANLWSSMFSPSPSTRVRETSDENGAEADVGSFGSTLVNEEVDICRRTGSVLSTVSPFEPVRFGKAYI